MVSPLDRKLLRDLARMKTQAAAIGLVIAMGVLLQVMMSGLVLSLEETRRAYYDRYRLADITVPVTRAPERLLQAIARIDGVAGVASRITGAALVRLDGQALPVQAQTLSLPASGRPEVNDIYLTSGRLPDPRRPAEVIVLDSFAAAHGLGPGDVLRVTMDGARRDLAIVGLAQAPEFIYTAAPGELVPDDARFAALWFGQKALAASRDMDGAWSEALIRLGRSADEAAVMAALEALLEPYGGPGPLARGELMSDDFVSQEIAGLRASRAVVPPFFMAVAAFLLTIVIGRMVESEREQIGLLKAFGYTPLEIGGHYARFVMVIALAGSVAGCLLGVASGRAMIGVYASVFKFPFLVFLLDPASFVIALAVSLGAASVGAGLVLRRVFALEPAEAMRPAAPADFSRAGQSIAWLIRWLDQPSRMVLRRVMRNRGRMAGSVAGIAAGMALSLSMITLYAGFDETLELTFGVIDRSDVTVSFTHPVADRAAFDLERLPGVIRVEKARHVPAILRNGRHTHRGAVTGLDPGARLSRAVAADLSDIALPRAGLVVSRSLADMLQVAPGDTLTVEVRSGAQPVLHLPVAAIADTLLGAPVFMDRAALNRALGEPHRITAAYLSVDPVQTDALLKELRDMPLVAGVSRKEDARQAFKTIMDTGAGAIRYVMGLIAFIITFGIIYNTARIGLAERQRDLASLRVIGFTKGEATFVLLGELGLVTLAAIPIGALAGRALSHGIAAGFSNEIYQIPVVFDAPSFGIALLTVLSAAIASGWLVARGMARTDLVAALKTKE